LWFNGLSKGWKAIGQEAGKPGSYEASDNWKLPGLPASELQAPVNDVLKTLK
jgi:hypothetical protein